MTVNIQRTLTPFTDLDDVFELRIAGDPTAGATGIQATGTTTDLNQRYCPLSIGSAIATNTGIQRVGTTTDLRSIFAANGSVVRISAPWDGDTYNVDVIETGSSTAIADLDFILESDGTFTATSAGSSAGILSPVFETGTFVNVGSASDYQARITLSFTSNIGADVINEMSSYVTLNANRTLSITCANNLGVEEAIGEATVSIRRVSDSVVVSTSSFNFSVRADGTS